MWPRTREDQLLQRYQAEQPGELFLELAVGAGDANRGPRRIDGLLIPGLEPAVRRPTEYTLEDARTAIAGRPVHLLEAKYVLNRNVIGQVLVGAHLLKEEFGPAAVVPVAVCGHRNSTLEGFCEAHGIRTAYYPDVIPPTVAEEDEEIETAPRIDRRQPINPARQRAFMTGWTEAVAGRLYGSIRTKKTHANMGNLFGWIYGDQPEEFRLVTWERYVERFEAERS